MKIFRSPTYDHHYTPERFFAKLRCLSGRVIALVVIKAVILYELLKKHDTPYVVKAAIIGALGYLISPLDVVPDVLPGGYADDIALMAGLIASLDYLINGEIRRNAEARASCIMDGDDEEEGQPESGWRTS